MSVEVITFGCRLNAFESEVIGREAANAGLTETIVINSCAVTNEAVAQARQSIRRLKRERPEARIVVTGCAAMHGATRARRSALAAAKKSRWLTSWLCERWRRICWKGSSAGCRAYSFR